MKARITESALKKLELSTKPYEVVDTQLRGFILRVQPTGSKTYYFAYRNPAGKKSRIKIGSTNSLSVAQARDLAEQHSANVIKGQDVQRKKKEDRREAKRIQDSTLGKFLDNYYHPWVVQNRKAGEKTVQTIRRNFSPYFSESLADISVLIIEKWRTERLKQGAKPSTINRDVTALRGLLSKAVEWEVIDTHPLAKLKQLKEDSSPNVRFLSAEEEERLAKSLSDRDEEIRSGRDKGNQFRKERGYELLPDLREVAFADRLTPMVTISLKTGVRQGELFDLLWKDVSFDNNVLTIRAEATKSNKTRHIPLSPTVRSVLKRWQKQSADTEPESRVFPGKGGARLNNMKRSWTGVLNAAKVKNFRWHDMRHDFASKLVMKGVPLNTVRELCGHADIATTLRYAHLAPDHKSEAIALLG